MEVELQKYQLIKAICIFFVIALFATSCSDNSSSESNNLETSIINKTKSPYVILSDTVIKTNLTIEKGVVIELADSISVTIYGDLLIKGTIDERVVFKPLNNSWEFIILKGENKLCDIEFTSFMNGKVICEENTNAQLKNTSFKNTVIQNYIDGLFVMNFGTFTADSITMISNCSGEGFVLGNLKQVEIRNSYFENVNDAFEILNCKKGLIYNCVFDGSTYDDAIDLNGCEDILIQNNSFKNIGQSCIEIGYHSYYKSISTNILIVNNTIENSKIGLFIKESSNVIAGLNTISQCEYAIEVDSSTNFISNYNSLITKLDSSLCKFSILNSTIQWTSCASDLELEGKGNCILESGKSKQVSCEIPINVFTKTFNLPIDQIGPIDSCSIFKNSQIENFFKNSHKN